MNFQYLKHALSMGAKIPAHSWPAFPKTSGIALQNAMPEATSDTDSDDLDVLGLARVARYLLS